MRMAEELGHGGALLYRASILQGPGRGASGTDHRPARAAPGGRIPAAGGDPAAARRDHLRANLPARGVSLFWRGGPSHACWTSAERVMGAILLGIVTHDANLARRASEA